MMNHMPLVAHHDLHVTDPRLPEVTPGGDGIHDEPERDHGWVIVGSIVALTSIVIAAAKLLN